LIVGGGPELVESEPNDHRTWRQHFPSRVRSVAESGHQQTADVDLFRFDAKRADWIIETVAAQRRLAIDTKIEVLRADGKPVERLLLQAVRNSAVTFRGVGSDGTDCRVENWRKWN